MSAVSWIGGSGSWNTPADWSTGAVPRPGDNVTISTSSAATISLPAGDAVSLGSLSTGGNATLALEPGALIVTGSYTQGSASSLSFSIDGTRAGIDYGVLDVQGAATLEGTVKLAFAPGYLPGSFDTYQPLMYGSETGSPTVSLRAGESDFLTPTSLYLVPAGTGTVTVTNTSDGGAGSLRNAIGVANVMTNPVELVTFNIPTSDPGYHAGVWTIAPGSALPVISGHAIVDATTQPGYAGKPVIDLSGAGAGNVNGLELSGGYSRVSGLAINGFGGDGVTIDAISSGNTVDADFIGTNASGETALANGGNGVTVFGPGNVVGGTSAGARNVISGNGANGVLISGTGATGNTVEGNYLGTDASGTKRLGNSSDGLNIAGGATGNTVGGTAAGNVVSANGADGVGMTDSGTSGNQVLGNLIGTDFTGTQPLGNHNQGVVILNTASGNIVGGTSPAARNVISANSNGVIVAFSGPFQNVVEGNLIGTDISGKKPLANAVDGVFLFGAASNNMIGGSTPGAGNVISGNNFDGVQIRDAGTSGNLILGNKIGTDPTGAQALANADEGVDISNGATNNFVGRARAGNVISGNAADGVDIDDSGTTGNQVLGNHIGVNAAGTQALPNGGSGVAVFNSAADATVGGTANGAGNVIGGNVLDGVFVDATSSGNTVAGNLIGTNVSGTAAIPNATDSQRTDLAGVKLAGQNNVVGGTTSGARNLISGNIDNGVLITGTAASGNLVEGNLIGAQLGGASPLGNVGNGVSIISGASGNTIGGSAAGDANTIAFNTVDGVHVDTGVHNAISRNSIFANGHLGIELTNGGNNNQAAPVLEFVSSTSTGGTTIVGSLASTPNSTFTVEFFSNKATAGSAEGQTFLLAATVSTGPSGKGNFVVSSPSVFAPAGQQVFTGTATDATGDTSAFSAPYVPPTLATQPGPTVVLGTGAPLTASATLSGGYKPGGALIFDLYAPGSISPVYSDVVGVSGDGTYFSSSPGKMTGSAVPTVPGTYHWSVLYSGDAFNPPLGPATTSEIAVGPGATVVGNVLYLIGGNTNDQVNIRPTGKSTTGSTGIRLDANLNGMKINNAYNQAFSDIDVFGFGGNDNINMANTLSMPAIVTEGNGNDNIRLSNGNNTVVVGNGNDQINAGNGNNTITLNNAGPPGAGGHPAPPMNDMIQLGNGNNSVTAGDGNFNLHAGTGGNVVIAGNGNDHVILGTPTPPSPPGMPAAANANFVVLGSGNDQIQAAGGNNTLVAGSGDDNVQVGNGNNAIVLLNGHDNVQAGDGANNITVGSGGDTIHAGDGNNVIVAGNGNNNITAGNGDNLIAGGSATDNIQVGNGGNILIDGAVPVPATVLRTVLDEWINALAHYHTSPASFNNDVVAIRAALAPLVTYNKTNANTLHAGAGLDWFWSIYSADHINAKPQDLRN